MKKSESYPNCKLDIEIIDMLKECQIKKESPRIEIYAFEKCSHLNKFSRFKELCRLKGESEPTYKPYKQTILKSLGCKELIRPVLNIEDSYSPDQIVLSWYVIDHSIGMRIVSSDIMPFIDKFLVFGMSHKTNITKEVNKNEQFRLIGEFEPGSRFPAKLLLQDVGRNALYGFKVQVRFLDKTLSMFSNIERISL